MPYIKTKSSDKLINVRDYHKVDKVGDSTAKGILSFKLRDKMSYEDINSFLLDNAKNPIIELYLDIYKAPDTYESNPDPVLLDTFEGFGIEYDINLINGQTYEIILYRNDRIADVNETKSSIIDTQKHVALLMEGL